MKTIEFTVRAERTVTLVRPEEGLLRVTLKPTAAFLELPAAEQGELLDTAQRETMFYFAKARHVVEFYGAAINQWFDIEINSECWEYNGGECHTIAEHYNSVARK